MSLNIKLEKVVNEDIDKNLFKDYVNIDEFNTLSSQNENLKLLLSYNKVKCDEQFLEITELNKKIFESDESIHRLQNQILLLKQSKESSSNIILEKDKHLTSLYHTLNTMDISFSEKSQIFDPKNATRRLNKLQYITKDLQNKVTSNKILIMTMCKILGCDSSKIIQSMKDIINENEVYKRKCKSFENFYQKSIALTKNMSFELHRNGYEKAPSLNNDNFCQFHSDNIDFWNKKMANTRYQIIQKKDRNNYLCPAYNSIMPEFNRHIPPPNIAEFQVSPYVHNLPGFNNNSAYNQHQISKPLIQKTCIQYLPTSFGSNNKIIPSSSHIDNISNLNDKPVTNAQFLKASNSKFFEGDGMQKINKASQNYSKNLDTNTNVYDWKNFSIEEGKMEQLKNENEISETLDYQSSKRICKNKEWIFNSNEEKDDDVDINITNKRFKCSS